MNVSKEYNIHQQLTQQMTQVRQAQSEMHASLQLILAIS